jgi:hypothetical protein
MVITVPLYNLKIEDVRNLGQARELLDQLCRGATKYRRYTPDQCLAMSKAANQIYVLSRVDPTEIAKIFKDLNIEIEEIKR